MNDMAHLHPSLIGFTPDGPGGHREREVLEHLEQGLDEHFSVFHHLSWSAMANERQVFGEFDAVVLSPQGHIVILEVKSGDVEVGASGLTKRYGRETKSINHQIQRLYNGLRERMRKGELPETSIATLLVLPDARISQALAAYPRERIVDSAEIERLCTRVRECMDLSQTLESSQHQRVFDFLANRFEVVPDVATHADQAQRTSTQLASGLATWVPRIAHESGLYQIEATAGSGKTQLALTLLRAAAQAGQRARYVCYNRPLADHLGQLAPPRCEVSTFHQLCHEHAERAGETVDFSKEGVFTQLEQRYLADAPQFKKRLDLLIVDEVQDFEETWILALAESLNDNARFYVMGDSQQELYNRDVFDLQGAVQVRCMDNFRSPRAVVDFINQLDLTPEPIEARGAVTGLTPRLHVHGEGAQAELKAIHGCLQGLWQEGFRPSQVVVLSYAGLQKARTPKLETLGGEPTRRPMGFDSHSNALWSEGTLLVDSLHRFKGQSMPVVVITEVDFAELNPREKRKLLVGLTRALLRVELVLSERAANILQTKL